MPGDERGVRGAEPDNGRCDLVGLSQPSQWVEGFDGARFCRSVVNPARASNGVSMNAGRTALIRIWCGAYSSAAAFVRPSTPSLAAVNCRMDEMHEPLDYSEANFLVDIADNETRTGARKRLARSPAEARLSTGDERDFSQQLLAFHALTML